MLTRLTPGFELVRNGLASISGKTVPLKGELRIFVAKGAQYSTWRQFPRAIQYEVEQPSGEVHITVDLSMSISDCPDMHASYAKQEENRVVAKSFTDDVYLRNGALQNTGALP